MFDFSEVPQWYCTGTCNPVGDESLGPNCQQADADLYCALLTGDPSAVATSWEQGAVIRAPGFCCLGLDESTIDLGPIPKYDIDALCYQDSNMQANHMFGFAILGSEVTCE